MCVSLITGPRLLSVLGRDVTLEKTCGSIADCTFDELCGRVSDVFFLKILFFYRYILYISQFASITHILTRPMHIDDHHL